MSLHRPLAAVSLIALLVIAGCDSAEPTPTMPAPSASSSAPEPTQTPSVDPLAVPAGAKEATQEGAEVLIRHFWDMVAHLRETGDGRPVRLTYVDSCYYCEAGVQFFESNLKQGHTFTGTSDAVASVDAILIGDRQQTAYAEVVTKSTRHVQLDASGKVMNRFPRTLTTMGYFLALQKGAWVITNVGEPE